MPLYSRHGSYPVQHIGDGDGWKEVDDRPEPRNGEEVVWSGHIWVTRPIKPDDEEGFIWKWMSEFNRWEKFERKIQKLDLGTPDATQNEIV